MQEDYLKLLVKYTFYINKNQSIYKKNKGKLKKNSSILNANQQIARIYIGKFMNS